MGILNILRHKKLPRRYDNFYLAWVEEAGSFRYDLCIIFHDKQHIPTHYITFLSTSSYFIPIGIGHCIIRQTQNRLAYYSAHVQEIKPRKFNRKTMRIVRYLTIRHYMDILPIRRDLITLIQQICGNQKQHLQP